MSDRVDVLAVIEREARCLASLQPREADELLTASKVVADLIAASLRVTAAFRANGREPGFCPRTHQECEAAIASLDRVNNRVGGAA